jgi:hypothetical protein
MEHVSVDNGVQQAFPWILIRYITGNSDQNTSVGSQSYIRSESRETRMERFLGSRLLLVIVIDCDYQCLYKKE